METQPANSKFGIDIECTIVIVEDCNSVTRSAGFRKTFPKMNEFSFGQIKKEALQLQLFFKEIEWVADGFVYILIVRVVT